VDYLKLDACSGQGYSQGNTSWIKFRAARNHNVGCRQQCLFVRGVIKKHARTRACVMLVEVVVLLPFLPLLVVAYRNQLLPFC